MISDSGGLVSAVGNVPRSSPTRQAFAVRAQPAVPAVSRGVDPWVESTGCFVAMSQENVEFIRGVYAAFNGRDIARAIESADPDFEWVPDARSFESAVRGREEVQRFLEDQVETLGLRVEPEEFLIWAPRSLRSSGRT